MGELKALSIIGTSYKKRASREKGKKTIYENKLKYEIPEAVFKDKDNWKTGDFYYETGVKTIYGIIATITAGKSIFWKLSKK